MWSKTGRKIHHVHLLPDYMFMLKSCCTCKAPADAESFVSGSGTRLTVVIKAVSMVTNALNEPCVLTWSSGAISVS